MANNVMWGRTQVGLCGVKGKMYQSFKLVIMYFHLCFIF